MAKTGNRHWTSIALLDEMSLLYSLGCLPGRPWRWIKATSFESKCTRPGRRLHRTAAQAGFMNKVFGGSSDGSDKGQIKQQQQQQQPQPEQQQADPATEPVAEEGGKFVPIDLESSGGLGGSSEEVFGPLAMLAVGYAADEFERLRELLIDLEADIIKLVPCSRAMLAGTLGEALSSQPGRHEQLPQGTQRVIFLSGMYAMEVMEIIALYREAGLPEPVFAAAVPKNWDKNVGDLVADVFEDHQAMKQRAMAARVAKPQQ